MKGFPGLLATAAIKMHIVICNCIFPALEEKTP